MHPLPALHFELKLRFQSSLKKILLTLALTTSLTVQSQITSLDNLKILLSETKNSDTAASFPSSSNREKVLQNPNVFYATPGPWGTLRCAYIYLEAPKHLMDNFPLPNSRPSWVFPEAEKENMIHLLKSTGFTDDLINTLFDPKVATITEGNIFLFPSADMLLGITPENRRVIYTTLSKYQENEFHVDPVLIIGQDVKDWYRTSKLRPEIVSVIEKLTYKRGETTAFSDISLLLNYAQSDTEAKSIFKAMTRTRSIMVKIEVDRNTNVEQLVNYWTLGMGLRRKDVEPLVQSIIDTDGIEALPLSHMLPALVRKLLYTYPGMNLAKHGTFPDCHWTSLNFFNYDAHEYLLDSRLATNAVLENFTPVEPPYQYGDVLFFLNNATGDAYHSCVHLADNLVYTKNGRNLLSPWLIMKLDDVKKIYLYRGDGRVQGFRRKPEIK